MMTRATRTTMHRSGANNKRGQRQLLFLPYRHSSVSSAAAACAYACFWTALVCSRQSQSQNQNIHSCSTHNTGPHWHVAALTSDRRRTLSRQSASSRSRSISSSSLRTAWSDDHNDTPDDSSSTSTSSSSSSPFTTHSCISELLREFDYDAFILDQFGVLHNGKDPLEGALDCVQEIAGANNNNKKKDDQQQKTTTKKTTKKKGLLLTVLSNTSSPAKTTLDRLHHKLGFDRSLFIGAVTSGEEAARYIRDTFGRDADSDPDNDSSTNPERNRNRNHKRKRKFIWCTWDPSNENVPDPLEFLELCGSGVEPTVDVEQADFVVAHGSGVIRGVSQTSSTDDDDDGDDNDNNNDDPRNHEVRSMGNFLDDGNLGEGTPIHDLLLACAKRNLPLVCANPDEVVVYHDGGLKHMPGKIAKTYASILRDGGNENENENESASSSSSSPTIRIFGKPHKEHFEACLRELQIAYENAENDNDNDSEQRRPLRVAHVGDSLHHDVAGANAAGVPSIFVVGGIHSEELGPLPTREALEEFFAREGHTPTHVVPTFGY